MDAYIYIVVKLLWERKWEKVRPLVRKPKAPESCSSRGPSLSCATLFVRALDLLAVNP